MQLIDFRNDTCQVFVGTYYGQDCDKPKTEAKRTVVIYRNNGGVISADIARGVSWNDRGTASYNATDITEGEISSTLLFKLLECGITSGEEYDIVFGGDYCDGGQDLTRFDVFDIAASTIVESHFVTNIGTIVTPASPTKGVCVIESSLTIAGTDFVTVSGFTLPDMGVDAFVKSITLVPETDAPVTISGLDKTLKEGQSYTRGPLDGRTIDTSSVAFLSTGVTIEAIWEL